MARVTLITEKARSLYRLENAIYFIKSVLRFFISHDFALHFSDVIVSPKYVSKVHSSNKGIGGGHGVSVSDYMDDHDD